MSARVGVAGTRAGTFPLAEPPPTPSGQQDDQPDPFLTLSPASWVAAPPAGSKLHCSQSSLSTWLEGNKLELLLCPRIHRST